MSEKYEQAVLAKIARDYYLNKLSITDISEKFGLSRYLITKALDEAEKAGIVQINIKDVVKRNQISEKFLEEEFGLKKAFVLKDRPTKTQDSLAIIDFAATKISGYSKDYKNIGVTWGTTVLDTISHLPKTNHPDLNFVQLAGMSTVSYSPFANYSLVEIAAERLHANSFILPAPLYLMNDNIKKSFLEEPTFKGIEEKYRQLGIILCSIGTLKSIEGSEIWNDVKDQLFAGIDQDKVAGMIMGRAYDINGNLFDSIDKKIVGISQKDILKVPIRLAVITNRFKTEALIGALRTGLITHLVINQGIYDTLIKQLKA